MSEDRLNNNDKLNEISKVIPISGMYQNWFLDYASYVILERAVPFILDGLKPVQRRILHSLKELDDGRYHKVANLIGNTMKYHPHGDASIGDALVKLGQKGLLIDMQGNWGNVATGDKAAAARYIEARLSQFALDVCFSPKVTTWQTSYDGRANEPDWLPIKFPLLLFQGVEGIAVGLSTKILPHNFNELIDASISILKGRNKTIKPDFQSGGLADFSNYNDGKKGGKVRVRAKVNEIDKKTLQITELPYNVTTTTLIDSIIRANDKGKIKIKNIQNNTADKVDIIITITNDVSIDKTIDALFAFTDCEISIYPITCVIQNDAPVFTDVSTILKISTDNTKLILTQELEIQLNELSERWHNASLERIFIEEKIYRDIEEVDSWEGIIDVIFKGLKPFVNHLKREITDIRDAYLKGSVFIAPMFIGSGLQNKLLEAMSMKIPCITTDLANKSLNATKKEIMIAENEEEFAEKCIALFNNKEKTLNLIENGYKFVKSKYDWKKSTSKIIKLLKS